MKKNKIFWLIFSLVFALLNILSTTSSGICLFLYVVEYAIIGYFALKEPSKGFLFLILFSSVALEFDQFIYYDKVAPFKRLNLFSSANVYFIVSAFVLFMVYKNYYTKVDKEKEGKRFNRWIYILGLTGTVSFLIGYFLDDNGIGSDSFFLDVFVTELRLYILLAFTFTSTFILMRNPATKNDFQSSCYYILLGVTGATIISILLGLRGYYGPEKIMLAPLVVCFAPCIIAFVNKDEPLHFIDLTLLITILLLSFSCPHAMGSKWYLIVFAAILYFVWKKFNIKSSAFLIVMVVVGLYFVPLLGEMLSALFSDSDLASFKFSQALGMLDFFSSSSFESWFYSLDRSAQFRVDEPWNILLEYKDKPAFALFGKGFGGTITQHTSILDWAGPGAFSDDQVRYGVFFNMHETLAMLFLRHGFVGLFFFLTVIYLLIKRMSSPWALFALLWFVFFWTYGISFRLGAVALAIVFSDVNNVRYGKNHYKP